MHHSVKCKVAFFSLYENNLRIRRHCEKGGIAIVYENGYLTIVETQKKTRIEHVNNIPLTFGGAAEFNIANAMASALALYLSNISIDIIRQGLSSFVASAENTPGRLNLFEFAHFRFMVDYAHNPHGIKAMGRFLKNMNASMKVGIIAGVGDRRSQDIVSIGEESARIFDQVIIRFDRDNRGRTPEEIKDLLMQGIRKVDERKLVKTCPKETEAIDCAVKDAQPGSLIVLLSDDVTGALSAMKGYMSKKEKVHQTVEEAV